MEVLFQNQLRHRRSTKLHQIKTQPQLILRARGRDIDLTRRGLIMGVLNVTVDSFSDGGKHLSPQAALAHARRMIAEGADIIDIGGESTRPGASPVPLEVEMERVIPVIEALARESTVLLSVDSSKAAVAAAAVDAGAHILNDVAGFRDEAMLDVAQRSGAGMIAMHMQGTPQTMQIAPAYDDVVSEVRDFFRQSLARFLESGIDPSCVAFDPGIGFGKDVSHNLKLLAGVAELAVDGRPILIGVSRKSFIAKIIGDSAMERRLGPTVALTAAARLQGARIFRVHDVRENLDALRTIEALMETEAR